MIDAPVAVFLNVLACRFERYAVQFAESVNSYLSNIDGALARRFPPSMSCLSTIAHSQERKPKPLFNGKAVDRT